MSGFINTGGAGGGGSADGYAFLNGVPGGQTLIGGTQPNNSLVLESTANVSKGIIDIRDRINNSTGYTKFGGAVSAPSGFDDVGDVVIGGDAYVSGNLIATQLQLPSIQYGLPEATVLQTSATETLSIHDIYTGGDDTWVSLDGNANFKFGTHSGSYITSGANNFLFGGYSGSSSVSDIATHPNAITTGSGNIMMGFGACPGTATQISNSVGIGYNAAPMDNYVMALGGSGVDAVKVGIGTGNPLRTLDIIGDAYISGGLVNTNLKLALDGYAVSSSLLDYALLGGRNGGQILIGGTAASNNLALKGSSNATDGYIQARSRISGFNSYLNLGTLEATSLTGYNAIGDVAMGANLFIRGNSYTAGTGTFGNSTTVSNDVNVNGYLGVGNAGGTDSLRRLIINVVTNDGVHIGTYNTSGKSNANLIFCDAAQGFSSYGHALSTSPTLFIHSVTAPGTSTAQWMSLAHDTARGRITTGLGCLNLGTAAIPTSGYDDIGDVCVGGDCETKGNSLIDGYCIATTAGIRTRISIADVTTPTNAELVAAFGTAANTGAGFVGIVNDNNGGTSEFIVWSDGSSYFYIAGTKAL